MERNHREFEKLQTPWKSFMFYYVRQQSHPGGFKRFDHKFLDGGVFRFALDNFNNLEGVRERKFVNQLMQTRLEQLANKLDPNVSGSLVTVSGWRASSTSMTKWK